MKRIRKYEPNERGESRAGESRAGESDADGRDESLEAGQDQEGRVLTTKESFSQENISILNASAPNRRASEQSNCEEGERNAQWASQQTGSVPGAQTRVRGLPVRTQDTWTTRSTGLTSPAGHSARPQRDHGCSQRY